MIENTVARGTLKLHSQQCKVLKEIHTLGQNAASFSRLSRSPKFFKIYRLHFLQTQKQCKFANGFATDVNVTPSFLCTCETDHGAKISNSVLTV
jgi:hypothetical protein